MPIFKTGLEESFNPSANHCIVLDLDETCVHTMESSSTDKLRELEIFTNPRYLPLRKRIYTISITDVLDTDRKGGGNHSEMWGIMRPHLKEFLLFCFSHFKIVAVWSAGRAGYVEAICDVIFKDIRPPHVIFTYDDCEANNSGILQKPLLKMINSDPVLKKHMSLENTFAIDDRLSTFDGVNPHNGILIPLYEPNPTPASMAMDDLALEQLKLWFRANPTGNVMEMDKSKIFSTSLNKLRQLK
jgi:hypothetical protein